jgi:hypothetical protein
VFEVIEEAIEVPQKLCDHMFERDGVKRGHPIAIRKFVGKGVIIMASIFVVLIFTGASLPSFSLSQYGLVGLAVEASPNQSTYVEHNVMSTVQLLMNQAKLTGLKSDHIGLAALSATFIITVVVVPILQLALLMRRWFGNLDKKARLRNFVAIEALQAWQYVEVYIFSILIACWQLGSVSEFLINDYCGSFDGLFNSLAYYGILDPMDSQCFKVQANVQEGAWVLVAASLTFLIINHLVSSAAKQQEADIKARTSTEVGNFAVFDGHDDAKLSAVCLKPRSPMFSDRYRWLLTKSSNEERETNLSLT